MLNITKKNKIACPICEEKIKNTNSAYLTYIKIEGDLQLHFLHKNCYKKVKKFERGE